MPNENPTSDGANLSLPGEMQPPTNFDRLKDLSLLTGA